MVEVAAERREAKICQDISILAFPSTIPMCESSRPWLNREYLDVPWEQVLAAAECLPTIQPVSELHRDGKSPSATSLACSRLRNYPFVTLQKGKDNLARLLPGACPALSLSLFHTLSPSLHLSLSPKKKKTTLRATLC